MYLCNLNIDLIMYHCLRNIHHPIEPRLWKIMGDRRWLRCLRHMDIDGYSMICIRRTPCFGAQLSTSRNLRAMETRHFLGERREKIWVYQYRISMIMMNLESTSELQRHSRNGVKNEQSAMEWLHKHLASSRQMSSEPSEASTRFATLSSPHFKRPAGRTCDTKTSQLLFRPGIDIKCPSLLKILEFW